MRLALLMLIPLLLSEAFAEPPPLCTGALSADQIKGCLTAPGPTRLPLMRGIRPSRGISVEGEQEKPAPASVNLTVNFEFNSARLTNDGMISLDALAQALGDPSLKDDRFRIAGHTDAVGSDDYNQKLSEARAGAVRTYLADHHNMNPSRFEVVGFGKTRLLDQNDPTAAVNRRVEVTKLTP